MKRGVVYGDIGTSPLYVYGTTFAGGPPADSQVTLGTMSTIFWTFTSIVVVKYVCITLLADDNGEGGLMALYALICRATGVRSAAQSHATDAVLTQFKEQAADSQQKGLAAKIRDGILTPAISVVSAMEGIQFQTGISTGAVVGISVAILVLLFAAQSLGTHKVSVVFSPIMLLWFLANAAIGIYNIATIDASVFKALSPHYMYYYWSGRASTAWTELGSVMLCVTGAEALYADLGHFSRPAIRISFAAVVYPSLTFTYLGQTAMILQSPETVTAAYWNSLPHPVYWPMVILATLAVNWSLMLCAIFVVAIFQTSEKLGTAYGLAVITVMLMDTTLLAVLALVGWGWSALATTAFWLVFSFICGAYLSSNLEKVPKGAWFPLALTGVLTTITYTWYYGQAAKAAYIQRNTIRLRDLFEEVDDADASRHGGSHHGARDAWAAMARHSMQSVVTTGTATTAAPRLHPDLQRLRLAGTKLPVARVPGVGVYFCELLDGVPPVLVRFLGQVPAIHEVVIFLTNRHVPVPFVMPEERLLVRKLRFRSFYHGPEFVSLVLNEIQEYLDPEVGGIADWRSLQDLETGSDGAPPSPTPRPFSLRRGAMQLMQVPLAEGEVAAADMSVMSAASTGSRRRVAFLSVPEGRAVAPDASGPPPWVQQPWVQQPSEVRRLRGGGDADKALDAKLGSPTQRSLTDGTTSLPLPPAAPHLHRLSAVLSAAKAAGEEGGPGAPGASLPLAADLTRPALPRAAAFAARGTRDATLSLPIPSRLARPPIYRVTSPAEGAPAASTAQAQAQPAREQRLARPTPEPAAVTLKGPAAHSMQQQVQRQLLEMQRLQQEAAARQAAWASEADGTGSHGEQELAQQPSGTSASRRQVFNLQSSVGSDSERLAPARNESAAEQELLSAALENGVTMMVGRAHVQAAPGSRFKAFWLRCAYQPILNNVESTYSAYRVPPDMLLELAVTYEI
eukprot:scaffold21.g2108.t1